MKSYYIISGTDRTSRGPFEESAVSEAYTHGEYPPNTLVRTEGMPGWLPIAEVFASPANVPSPDSKLPVPPSVSGLAGTDSHSPSCAYSNPFKALRYVCLHCTYQGRATRKEYWMAMLEVLSNRWFADWTSVRCIAGCYLHCPVRLSVVDTCYSTTPLPPPARHRLERQVANDSFRALHRRYCPPHFNLPGQPTRHQQVRPFGKVSGLTAGASGKRSPCCISAAWANNSVKK